MFGSCLKVEKFGDGSKPIVPLLFTPSHSWVKMDVNNPLKMVWNHRYWSIPKWEERSHRGFWHASTMVWMAGWSMFISWFKYVQNGWFEPNNYISTGDITWYNHQEWAFAIMPSFDRAGFGVYVELDGFTKIWCRRGMQMWGFNISRSVTKNIGQKKPGICEQARVCVHVCATMSKQKSSVQIQVCGLQLKFGSMLFDSKVSVKSWWF